MGGLGSGRWLRWCRWVWGRSSADLRRRKCAVGNHIAEPACAPGGRRAWRQCLGQVEPFRLGRGTQDEPSLRGDAFLEFAHRGMRHSQLFLTNAVSQKVDRFKPVYDLFRNSLVLVSPESTFGRTST